METAYDRDLVALPHIRLALWAEKSGYDGVAMGCLAEPGVSAAKEMLRIPVTGETEAALHVAASLGRRIAIVEGSIRGRRVMEELVAAYGFSRKVVSVRGIDASPLRFTTAGSTPVEMYLEAVRTAMEEDGADVIIGYGNLTLISRVQQAFPVPVISPIQASILFTEMLVRLGLRQSPLAYPRSVAAPGPGTGAENQEELS